MKEYIEKIIEIILENVSCEHPEIEEYPRGAKSNDPTYFLNNENTVIEKCIKAIPARLIERPEITDEIFEKKAKELHRYAETFETSVEDFKNYLQSLFKED